MKQYRRIRDAARDFFPALYRERIEAEQAAETPEETGKRLAREILRKRKKPQP